MEKNEYDGFVLSKKWYVGGHYYLEGDLFWFLFHNDKKDEKHSDTI